MVETERRGRMQRPKGVRTSRSNGQQLAATGFTSKRTNKNAFWRYPLIKACRWQMSGSQTQCRQCEICVLLLFVCFHGMKVGRISNTARELHFKKAFLPIMLKMD